MVPAVLNRDSHREAAPSSGQSTIFMRWLGPPTAKSSCSTRQLRLLWLGSFTRLVFYRTENCSRFLSRVKFWYNFSPGLRDHQGCPRVERNKKYIGTFKIHVKCENRFLLTFKTIDVLTAYSGDHFILRGCL